MTGRGRPDVGVAQRVRDGAVPARALAEHATTPGTATPEALLDSRQHLVQQEVLPSARGSRVDVLVAAEPGEAIREGDDNRWHVLFPDQPVEPFRQVLAEANPIRMGQAASGEADEGRRAEAIPVRHAGPGRRHRRRAPSDHPAYYS